MKDLNYQLEVNKKGQVTIPKTLREVMGIKEESFIDISYNKETNKLEINKSENKFNEQQINFLKSTLLNALSFDKQNVLFISGFSGVGKTTLVKEITNGLLIDGLKGKLKEYHFSDKGEVYIIDDIFNNEVDFTNQDKINNLKPTIITSQIEITSLNIKEENDRLYIYVILDNKRRGIKSIHLSKDGQIIEWMC